MPPVVAPASLARLPQLAWLMAHTFSRNRALAVASWPMSVATLLPYALRRVLYRSRDGNGMVIFGRYRPVFDFVLAIALALLIFAGMVATAVALWVTVGPLGVLAAALLFVVIGIAPLAMMSTAGFTMAVGSETPPGQRWTVMALTQRRGTRMSALLLARRLLEAVPPGALVVAVADSPALADGYVRLGFERGAGPRVFRRC
ncbi:hypothetical protein [Marisediminicola sp. LYQ134]|uniref:hypothetical protein n=1 Tax=Marisediminicola sp. LYQ134 TaxID=3391061 RepID=UPI0039835FF2